MGAHIEFGARNRSIFTLLRSALRDGVNVVFVSKLRSIAMFAPFAARLGLAGLLTMTSHDAKTVWFGLGLVWVGLMSVGLVEQSSCGPTTFASFVDNTAADVLGRWIKCMRGRVWAYERRVGRPVKLSTKDVRVIG